MVGGVNEKLMKVLERDPYKSYSACSLAQAAGMTSPQDRFLVESFMRSYTRFADLERGVCPVCGKADEIRIRFSRASP